MELLAASVGQQAATGTLYYMHLPLHWVGLSMLIATITAWLIFRWRGARLTRRLNSPRQLLRELIRLHEMSWSDRRLLLAAARRQKVKEPARFFLEPDLWRRAIEAERSQFTRRRLTLLQQKVLALKNGEAKP